MVRAGDDTQRQDDSVERRDDRSGHAWLHVFTSSSTRDAIRVPARGVTIGRAAAPPRADVVLDDPRTSRLHAGIARDDAGWRLTDLGSRNGGFVDGAVLEPHRSAALVAGSVVRLGDTVGVFATDDPDGDDDAGDRGFFPGVSAAAHRIRRRVRLLAAASGHTLVTGETGTGKERVARRLGRDAPPFVPVNCAELSRELARGELFGHARGAFTGASGARDGLVETARQGVLFLDEIGELPLDVQGELLRFLEDGSYRPVGASELRISQARVIAATNADLDAGVRAGSFRRDLLARLRAANEPLTLPPLRVHREDIPGWLDVFVREVTSNPPASAWTAGALECLLLFDWPENLRELRGAVRRAIEEPRTWPVPPARLPARVQAHRSGQRSLAVDRGPGFDDDGRRDPTRLQIEAALVESGGRMRAAAEALGLDRRKLYRMCEKLGIDLRVYRRGE